MRKSAAILVSFALSCTLTLWHSAEAQGGKFPGKGQRAAWEQANQFYNRGNDLVRAGKTSAAIPLYEKSIRLYPYDSDFYMNAATAYAAEPKTFALAQSSMEKAIRLDPTRYVLYSQYAVILVRQDKLTKARDVLLRARSLEKTPAQSKVLGDRIKDLERVLSVKH